jgi:hypothetical protein
MPFDPNQPYEIEAPSSPPAPVAQAEPSQPVSIVDHTIVPSFAYKALNAKADQATRFPLVEAGLGALKWGAQNLPSPGNYFLSDEQKQQAQQKLAGVPTSMPRFNPFTETPSTFRGVLESPIVNALYENIARPAGNFVSDAVGAGYNFVRKLEPEKFLTTPSRGLPRVSFPQMPDTMREALGEPYPKDIPTIHSKRDYKALRKGTWFRDSSGQLGRKP